MFVCLINNHVSSVVHKQDLCDVDNDLGLGTNVDLILKEKLFCNWNRRNVNTKPINIVMIWKK